MSLGDDLTNAINNASSTPSFYAQPAAAKVSHWEWDGNEGTIETEPLAERPTTWDAYLLKAGLAPEDVEVIEPVGIRGWQGLQREKDGTNTVVDLNYYSLKVRRRSELMTEMPLLLSEARLYTSLPTPVGKCDLANVVLWADPQTGKVARRGGSAELVARVGATMERLRVYLEDNPADEVVFLDLGDAIEGFENTRNQEGTNDLSLMDQIDLALTMEWQMLQLLAAQRGKVGVYGVGSNHCRWRSGKNSLGFPGDDWGIFMLKQLRKMTGIAGMDHVTVGWPNRHEETLTIEVLDKRLGLAHGHRAPKPEGVPLWWGKQVHGGQPLVHADILHTGHFHHLRVQPSGRNPWTDESKWWIQGATMDNGSDWYREIAGDDSDPGLVVYTLERGRRGYPFQNLQVL